MKHEIEEPAHGSKEYLELQRQAVYYLRSCIENEDGLSVLQFAADRGLITCVQTMLSTKDVFVIKTQTKEINKTTNKPETVTVREIDVTNLCPEYFVRKKILYSEEELDKLDPKQQEDNGIVSFLDALAEIQPPNKAGEILESIPMMSLTGLEWTVTQGIHLIWMVIHMSLMVFASIEIIPPYNDFMAESHNYNVLGTIVLTYATVITSFHGLVTIMRWKSNGKQATHSVKNSIRKYQKDDGAILERFVRWIRGIIYWIPVEVFSTVMLCELLFTGFAWLVFIPKMFNLDLDNWGWIKGFFLLLGWLMLLFPLTSFSPIYKLISVLKYIVIRDMSPWIVIYITVSIGFALAITLQFEDLPESSSCEDLTEFLSKTRYTFLELVVMTSGLDTDRKHVRSLACLFEENKKGLTVRLVLITIYAMISAVVLLNMLIAIMSNTVTEAQQDKGWRQYQVSYMCMSYLHRQIVEHLYLKT